MASISTTHNTDNEISVEKSIKLNKHQLTEAKNLEAKQIDENKTKIDFEMVKIIEHITAINRKFVEFKNKVTAYQAAIPTKTKKEKAYLLKILKTNSLLYMEIFKQLVDDMIIYTNDRNNGVVKTADELVAFEMGKDLYRELKMTTSELFIQINKFYKDINAYHKNIVDSIKKHGKSNIDIRNELYEIIVISVQNKSNNFITNNLSVDVTTLESSKAYSNLYKQFETYIKNSDIMVMVNSLTKSVLYDFKFENKKIDCYTLSIFFEAILSTAIINYYRKHTELDQNFTNIDRMQM